MKKTMRKRILTALMVALMIGSLAACGDTGGGGGSDWSQKDITIVVPFNAGGDTDFHARLLAQYAAEKLGVNIVVENVAGANGSQGMMQLMAGGGVALIGMQLIPMLANLFTV